MKSKFLGLAIASIAALGLVACNDQTSSGQSSTESSGGEESSQVSQSIDLSENIELKFMLCYGNKSRTMTYNQSSPITLSDGKTTISAGQLKPMWSYVANEMNATFKDVAVQDQKASEMLQTQSATGFVDAQIYGGNSVATDIMSYGVDGKFLSLTELMNAGYMPNYQQYLKDNPSIAASITAYDGNIYHVPYIAEVGNFARAYHLRESWVTKLLDQSATYDTSEFTTYYSGFYKDSNTRTGLNGGSVTPKEGTNIVKKTNQNIIEIQNALPVKNGQTLANALVQYIKDNYSYTNPSELYVGDKAAYDIDELVALFRVIKANPSLLTDGKATAVYPFFTRQSSYREDLLRLATYFDGVRVHGSDSYSNESRWFIDENGEIQYTYTQEAFYNVLTYLSEMQAEGLIYNDIYNLTNKANFRSKLYGSDATDTPSYGFMTYDWIASTTADNLNTDIQTVLPPVAKVNGVWQYYIDNSRAVKPDGWAISASCTEQQKLRAAATLDYFFTEEGHILQNYGLPQDLEETETITGPDGISYPKYKEWTIKQAKEVAKGDLSTFLRDWMGCQMPIGYQKEIGFEYQYTSERGFAGWALLQNSTCNIPTYAGTGLTGTNSNFYKVTPAVFSFTKRQSESLTELGMNSTNFEEVAFNVVRYKTVGDAPTGTKLFTTYADYLNYYKENGLDTFVSTYQAAYAAANDK